MKISDKQIAEHLKKKDGRVRRKSWKEGCYVARGGNSYQAPEATVTFLYDEGGDRYTPSLDAISADDWELLPLPPRDEFFQLRPEAKCFVERRHLIGNVDPKGYVTIDRIYFVRHGHVERFLDAQKAGKKTVMEHMADLIVEGNRVIKNSGAHS